MAYLNGIDISHYQRTTPSLAGRAFVIVKASNGDDKDPRYDYHVANIRKDGLVVGAYHFGVGAAQASIASQVAAFVAASKGADILALDLERNVRVRRKVGDKLVWVQLPSMTRAEGREFIRLLRPRAAGRKILLYSSRGTWPGDLGQDANWVADYSGDPNRPGVSPRIKWAFWQYTSTPYDLNKFNGNKAQLLALAGRAPIEPPAQPVPPKEAPVATEDQVRLGKAIDTRAGYLNNEIAAGDEGGILTQAAKIADFATRLVVSVAGPAADTSEYFLDFGEGADTVYLPGGSPGNPNGVSFTFAGARKWWEEVFAKGYNIGKVRSTLTPGSKVLSPEGYDAAVALARTSVNFAPEDYNPLGLDVIP